MQARTGWSLGVIILGVILFIIGSSINEGGYLSLFIGAPLVLLGIFLLLSCIGTVIIFVGAILNLIGLASSVPSVSIIAYIVMIVGIIYGVVDKIVHMSKNSSKRISSKSAGKSRKKRK